MRERVRVRQAQAGDIRTIAELNAIVQRVHFDNRPDRFVEPDPDATEPKFAEQLASDRTRVFLAEEAGEVEETGTAVGYVLCYLEDRTATPLTAARRVVVLDEIAVRTDCRRAGAGGQLVDAVFDFARQARADGVEVTVWEFNDAARAFFASQPFAPMTRKLEARLASPTGARGEARAMSRRAGS